MKEWGNEDMKTWRNENICYRKLQIQFKALWEAVLDGPKILNIHEESSGRLSINEQQEV